MKTKENNKDMRILSARFGKKQQSVVVCGGMTEKSISLVHLGIRNVHV